MPQIGNLILTDRATTPVDHTFVPRDIVNGVATCVEATGIPIGENRVAMKLVRTRSGRYKPTLNFTLPVVQNETINGVVKPAVVRTAYAEVTFNFDGTSSLQERKDAVGMVMDALSADTTVIDGLLTKLENVY